MWEGLRRRQGVLPEAVIGAALLALLSYETAVNRSPWEFALGLVAVVVSVVTARRAPLVSLIATASSSVAILFDFAGRVPAWPIMLMLSMGFLAGRRMEHARPALITFAAVSATGIPISLAIGRHDLADWGGMTTVLVFAALFPWQIGRHFRMREELARTGWQRAQELEIQQRIVADEARLRERTRIASDMHDSLGHELALIAVRAGALEVAGGLDERQRSAATELRQSAATATERLREIIGVLRADESAPTEPADATIGELVERARASGIEIRSDVDDGGEAPPMVERAAYRVVQEALTNVAKHAPGAAVTVRVTRTKEETAVRVRNTAPPAGPLPGLPSGRRGLAGLRERVRLVGGTLRAGAAGGGFEVVATLPHHGSPAPASPVTDAELSESARQLAQRRRQVRRSLVYALIMPPSIMAAIAAVAGIWFAYTWLTSQLNFGEYDQMRIGQPRDEIAHLLPPRQRDERPPGPEPASPPGSVCEFYGTGVSMFDFRSDVFRLCFVDGRLASKDLFLDINQRYYQDDSGTAGR
ncbi:sensor histidine kinase [Amycolatopsis anabasis]|uniref:sensor histidine kinase n=1 Tax=Amycolatopsis anabasis TaxID=1840409 RepID=UPI001FE7721B|nr:histidine kinase [Amycolatopsis anabasis]